MQRIVVVLLSLGLACSGERKVASDASSPAAAGAATIGVAPSAAPTTPIASGGAPVQDAETPATDAPSSEPSAEQVPVPPPPKNAPALFRRLTTATLLEIKDQWNGLGATHDTFIRLERKGDVFVYRAKVVDSPGRLGERVPDPTTPRDPADGKPCVCALEQTCECEGRPEDIRHEEGSVPVATVERFLGFVASHAIDPAPPKTGRRWTDDYPKAHVLVVVPGSKPVHLSFLDQKRQWRLNGKALSAEPVAADGLPIAHSSINRSYRELLDAVGLAAWVKALR